MGITVTEEQVDLVNTTLREAAEREGRLRKSLEWYITRQAELFEEIYAGREREIELQQKCTSLEAKAAGWESLFNEALARFKQVEARITTMEKERAEQQMDAEEKSLPSHLAAQHTEGEDLAFSPKDLKIQTLQSQLALMEKTQVKWGAEMEDEAKSSSERTIEVLREVTHRVLALTVDVEESQLGHKYGSPTKSIHRQRQELPEYLRSNDLESRKFECFDNIRCAQAALAEAAKSWKKAQNGIVAMQSVLRKEIIDIIVGHKELDP